MEHARGDSLYPLFPGELQELPDQFHPDAALLKFISDDYSEFCLIGCMGLNQPANSGNLRYRRAD